MSPYNKRTNKRKNNCQSRIITLGEINDETANEVIELIYEINYDDFKKEPENREPINLIINSPGGCVYSGFGLADVIINSKTPVYTTCHGMSMSMGFLVLIAGHKRSASKNSTLMYHEILWELDERPLTHHKREVKETNRLMKIYDEFIIERTELTSKILNPIKERNQNWYITPEEALRFRIIDEII